MTQKEALLPKDQHSHLWQVARNWPVGEISNLVDYSNLGAHGGVVKVTTDKGDFALKRYDSYTSGKIPFFHNVYDHLLNHGFDNFPYPVKTIRNEGVFVDDEGNTWEIVPWLSGSSLSSLNMSSSLVIGATELIARFHRTGAVFSKDQHTVFDKSHAEVWIPEMISRRQKLGVSSAKYRDPEIDSLVSDLMQLSTSIITLLTSESFSQLEKSLPSCVIHADLSFDHIIFDGNEYKLIDFDRMRVGKRLVDVERLITESSKLNPQLEYVAMSSYQHHLDLSRDEKDLLPLFIAYQRVRRAYWRADRLVSNPKFFIQERKNFREELLSAKTYLSNFQG